MTLLTLQDAFMKITNIDSVEKDTKKKKHLLKHFDNVPMKYFEEYY